MGDLVMVKRNPPAGREIAWINALVLYVRVRAWLPTRFGASRVLGSHIPQDRTYVQHVCRYFYHRCLQTSQASGWSL